VRRDPDVTRRASLYWLFVLLVVGFALAGYMGYVVYPRLDLPAPTGIGLLVLSVGAGVASFFSHCSFPLLITLLARQTGVDVRQDRSRPSGGRALVFASALALGASVFLLLVGFFIALGGAALFEGVTFTSAAGRVIRAIVGGLLILLGRTAERVGRCVTKWVRCRAFWKRSLWPLGWPGRFYGRSS
jgi:cytochrome c biogenesis protein CcdA